MTLILIIIAAIVVAVLLLVGGGLFIIPRSRRGQAVISRIIQRSPRMQRVALRQMESALEKDPQLLSKLPVDQDNPMLAQAQQLLAHMPPAQRQQAMRKALKMMDSGQAPTNADDIDPQLLEQALAAAPQPARKPNAQERAQSQRKRKSQRGARKANRKR